jgi:hypothetical protein
MMRDQITRSNNSWSLELIAAQRPLAGSSELRNRRGYSTGLHCTGGNETAFLNALKTGFDG